MAKKRQIPVAVVATLAVACGAFATPAAAKDDHVVRPQFDPASINGISLGDTKTQVYRSTPLGRNKPTSSVVTSLPSGKKVRTETYLSRGRADTLVVIYSIPKKKKKHPKVLYVSTGSGFWILARTNIQYDTASGYASPRSEFASWCPTCTFYEHDASGHRLYDPDPGDGQYSELRYPNGGFFYFTFNEGGLASDVEAQLAGFTLSRYRIP
jgi:hypothetical protein